MLDLARRFFDVRRDRPQTGVGRVLEVVQEGLADDFGVRLGGRLGTVHQIEVGLHGAGGDDQVVVHQLRRHPAFTGNARQLGAFDRFTDDRRDLAGEGLARGVQGLGRIDQPAAVEAHQLLGSSGIGRRHGDDGVEAPRPQHRAIDPIGMVGGQNRDDLVILALHAVEGVQHVIDRDAALIAGDHAVDVFSEDDHRRVAVGEVQHLLQAGDTIQHDERPAVVDGQLGRRGGGHGLADAVAAFEQDAPLQGDLQFPAGFRILDGREQVGLDLVLHIVREDQVADRLVGQLQELRLLLRVQLALLVHEHADRLALVDGLGVRIDAGQGNQGLEVVTLVLADGAADLEDVLAVLHRRRRFEGRVHLRDVGLAPEHLDGVLGPRTDLDRANDRRDFDAEEAALGLHDPPAVEGFDGLAEGLGAVPGEGVDDLGDGDLLLFLIGLAAEDLGRFAQGHRGRFGRQAEPATTPFDVVRAGAFTSRGDAHAVAGEKRPDFGVRLVLVLNFLDGAMLEVIVGSANHS